MLVFFIPPIKSSGAIESSSMKKQSKNHLLNFVQLKNPQILTEYFGATQQFPKSIITATPYSVVYQRHTQA